jgi:acyl-coenzyme A synthetase/AMP-(fatty) acid ligase
MTSPVELWQRFSSDAARRSHVAVGCGETCLTYPELIDRSEATAASWLNLVKQDHKLRVLILRRNPLDTLISVLAAWRLDATAAVLRPYGPRDVPEIYTKTVAPDIIVTDDAVIGGSGNRDGIARDECLILATSGTMTEPKLVALTATGVDLTVSAIAGDLAISESDRLLVASPLSFVYGLFGGALAALRQGAEAFLYPPLTAPSSLQNDIRQNNITIVQGPASMHRLHLQFWNGKPFESVRLMTQGGEFCGGVLASQLAAIYPRAAHVQVFGMTECGRISHKAFADPASVSNEIGTPFAHIQYKIVPVDQGVASEGGLLSLKGPSIMLGYVKPGVGYWGVDKEGYFRSNDLVTTTPDGGLRHLGRFDRCFKTGGKLINPAAIENLLMNTQSVSRVVCHAKEHKILGFVPSVKVVLGKRARQTAQQLKSLCELELEQHMVPHEIDVVDDLPQTFGGKTLLRTSPGS